MQGPWTLCLSVLPALLWASPLFVERDSEASSICKTAPRWEIDGKAPMEELHGHVVMVALLKAS